jgi:hypothetical protein
MNGSIGACSGRGVRESWESPLINGITGNGTSAEARLQPENLGIEYVQSGETVLSRFFTITAGTPL